MYQLYDEVFIVVDVHYHGDRNQEEGMKLECVINAGLHFILVLNVSTMLWNASRQCDSWNKTANNSC